MSKRELLGMDRFKPKGADDGRREPIRSDKCRSGVVTGMRQFEE